MTDSAVILVGGRGTRLGSLTDETPKPLLPVAGRPFLLHVLDALQAHGIRRVCLATGYRAEKFADTLGPSWERLELTYSQEDEPLGTGGALRQALTAIAQPRVFVLNGDTLFRADLAALYQVHVEKGAQLSLILRPVDDVSRYGQILFSEGRAEAIREKCSTGPGYINGGIYLIEREPLLAETLPERFSIETDLLPKWIQAGVVACATSDAYFVDIGLPAALARADEDLRAHR
jgi:D-glycero-alpha-D-manno-heptose 1-phosphate guanylyltransferase